jgi:hypothetical protein
MARIVGLCAVAGWLAAATNDRRHRAGTKVAEPGKFQDEFITTLFKIIEGFGHVGLPL